MAKAVLNEFYKECSAKSDSKEPLTVSMRLTGIDPKADEKTVDPIFEDRGILMKNLRDYTANLGEGQMAQYLDCMFMPPGGGIELRKRLVFHHGQQQLDKRTSSCTNYCETNLVNPQLSVRCCLRNRTDNVVADKCKVFLFTISLTFDMTGMNANGWSMSIVLEKNMRDGSTPTLDKLKAIKSRLFTGDLNEKSFWECSAIERVDLICVDFEWQSSKVGDVPSFDWISGLTKFLENKKDKSVREVFVQASMLLRMNDEVIKKYQTGEWGIKKMMPQVITLNHAELHRDIIPNKSEYHITDKIDGMSFVCIIHNGMLTIGGGKYIYQFDLEPGVMEQIAEKNASGSWVFDAEGVISGSNIHLFPFDVSCANGVVLTSEPYIDRYPKIKLLANCTVRSQYKVLIHIKRTLSLTQYKPGIIEQFYAGQAAYAAAFPYPGIYRTDGIIFIRNGRFAVQSRSHANMYLLTPTFKWKEPWNTTIDFYVIECPRSLIGKPPYIAKEGYKIMLLCNGLDRYIRHKIRSFIPIPQDGNRGAGASNEQYSPVLFSPGDDPYMHIYMYGKGMESKGMVANAVANAVANTEGKDGESKGTESKGTESERKELNAGPAFNEILNDGTIAEFSWGSSWELRAIRHDRQVEVARGTYFGNDSRVAELNALMIKHPISIKDIDFPDETKRSPYFMYLDPRLVDYFGLLYASVLDKLADKGFTIANVIDVGVSPLLDCFKKCASVLSVCDNAWQANQLIHERYKKVPDMRVDHYYIVAPWHLMYNIELDIEKRGFRIPYRRGINVIFVCMRFGHIAEKADLGVMLGSLAKMLAPGGVIVTTRLSDANARRFGYLDGETLEASMRSIDGKLVHSGSCQDYVRSNEMKLPIIVSIYQFENVQVKAKRRGRPVI